MNNLIIRNAVLKRLWATITMEPLKYDIFITIIVNEHERDSTGISIALLDVNEHKRDSTGISIALLDVNEHERDSTGISIALLVSGLPLELIHKYNIESWFGLSQ